MIAPRTITDLLSARWFVFLLLLSARQAAADDGGDLPSQLSHYPLNKQHSQQWRLPDRLNEISGLALGADGRLFAVADEMAIIYELDYDEGRIIKAFAFGQKTVRGDFEGIALLRGRIYLTTSDGEIYVGPEGEDGERVAFESFETGIGRQCEIEGLAQLPEEHSLLLVCKRVRRGSELNRLAVFTWSATDQSVLGPSIELPEREIFRKLRVDRINPSGIVADPESGHLLILAARQHALVELSRDGRLIDATTLPLESRHRQAEGIEIGEDGKLLIADEGGSHKARLAVYLQDE